MEQADTRGSFSGKMGFIMAAAGSAVGLGNLWRFPYLAEQYGGGIFLLTYVVLVIIFGIMLMITELAIGRRTGKSCIDAFIEMSSKYKVIGWLAALVPIIIVPYYCVVGGWVTKYFVNYAFDSGVDLAVPGFFDDFKAASLPGIFDSPVTWFLIFAFLTVAVVVFGVEKGIEKISKILMPALFVLLIGLCVYMLTLDGFVDGVADYIVPDLGEFSMNTVLGALGQLFYSLSLAMGIMITYGSYMKKNVDIEKAALSISLTDMMVAFFCGFLIVPAIAVFSTQAISSGPGLMFETMPLVFDSMSGQGVIVGAAFFLLAMFAAWTSSISLTETVVSLFKDHLKWKRTLACLVAAVLIVGVGMLSCLGYGPLAGITILDKEFLDFFDFITNSVLMPIVAMATCFVVGHVVTTKFVEEEVEISSKFRSKKLYGVMIQWVCPVLIFIILVMGLLDGFGIYSI